MSIRIGRSLWCCLLGCAGLSVLTAATVELKRAQYQIDIRIDGKPFTTYYFDPQMAKPYLMPLRTASGDVISRPFPVRNDVSMANPKMKAFEPHQRPLYFGHGNVDGLDFWGEAVFDRYFHQRQAYGRMVLKNVEDAHEQAASAVIRARFTELSPNNRVIGEQVQSFVFSGGPRTRTIDCTFVLYATNGPIDLGDTKEGTFGIRLGPELSAPNVRMVNSNGAVGEKEIWGKPADWVDYSGTISGQPAGIAVFDHPESFRHPTTWHARSYGLFAANPFGLREFTQDPDRDGSWTIPGGKSLTFGYRVLIHEGEFSAERLKAEYERFAAEDNRPEVKQAQGHPIRRGATVPAGSR